jgi:hypothetical protein
MSRARSPGRPGRVLGTKACISDIAALHNKRFPLDQETSITPSADAQRLPPSSALLLFPSGGFDLHIFGLRVIREPIFLTLRFRPYSHPLHSEACRPDKLPQILPTCAWRQRAPATRKRSALRPQHARRRRRLQPTLAWLRLLGKGSEVRRSCPFGRHPVPTDKEDVLTDKHGWILRSFIFWRSGCLTVANRLAISATRTP